MTSKLEDATPSSELQDTPMEDVSKENKDSNDQSENKEENDRTGEKLDAKKKAPSLPPPPRPIKKARTAYFIFADDKRAEFQAAHPGEGVGVVARLTGQAWAALSPEERASYQNRAAEDRARVAKELEEYKAKYGDVPDVKSPHATESDTLVMPVARIRKIAKLDPEVKGMSKEAITLITKCTELFTAKLGKETVKVANLQNRRKLLPEDVAQVCASREQFLFLSQDVKDLIREQAQEHKHTKQQSKKQNDAAAANSKPLTAYFGASN